MLQCFSEAMLKKKQQILFSASYERKEIEFVNQLIFVLLLLIGLPLYAPLPLSFFSLFSLPSPSSPSPLPLPRSLLPLFSLHPTDLYWAVSLCTPPRAIGCLKFLPVVTSLSLAFVLPATAPEGGMRRHPSSAGLSEYFTKPQSAS